MTVLNLLKKKVRKQKEKDKKRKEETNGLYPMEISRGIGDSIDDDNDEKVIGPWSDINL